MKFYKKNKDVAIKQPWTQQLINVETDSIAKYVYIDRIIMTGSKILMIYIYNMVIQLNI